MAGPPTSASASSESPAGPLLSSLPTAKPLSAQSPGEVGRQATPRGKLPRWRPPAPVALPTAAQECQPPGFGGAWLTAHVGRLRSPQLKRRCGAPGRQDARAGLQLDSCSVPSPPPPAAATSHGSALLYADHAHTGPLPCQARGRAPHALDTG